MTISAAPAILIAPPTTRNVPSFCEVHLAGIFAHTDVDVAGDVDMAGTGALIAQTLDAGVIRPLRLALTATPSMTPTALPAAFLITHTKRLIAAHALLLALMDAPAIHMHHLLMQAAANLDDPETTWANLSTIQRKAFDILTRLLRTRAEHPAFASDAERHPMELPLEICAVVRTAPAATETSTTLPVHQRRVVCLVNVSAEEQLVSVDWRAVLGTRHAIRDLVSGVRFNVHGPSLALQPYQVVWATL